MSTDLEVAGVFRRYGQAYRRAHDGHLGRVERRVMSAIELCRTAALGGHVEACETCGVIRCAYNACRTRHCPKCQGQARADWLAERQAELLPVPYFHVVFTLPAPAAEIAFQNKGAVYAILFKAAAETLSTIAADRRHLGAEIGFVAVLHTAPSARALPRPRRRLVVGRGGVSTRLPSAGARSLSAVPAAVTCEPAGRVRGRKAGSSVRSPGWPMYRPSPGPWPSCGGRMEPIGWLRRSSPEPASTWHDS